MLLRDDLFPWLYFLRDNKEFGKLNLKPANFCGQIHWLNDLQRYYVGY